MYHIIVSNPSPVYGGMFLGMPVLKNYCSELKIHGKFQFVPEINNLLGWHFLHTFHALCMPDTVMSFFRFSLMWPACHREPSDIMDIGCEKTDLSRSPCLCTTQQKDLRRHSTRFSLSTENFYNYGDLDTTYWTERIICHFWALRKIRRRQFPTDKDTKRRRRISSKTYELSTPLWNIQF